MKYFTYEEANSALVLVAPIMRDLINKEMELGRLQKELQEKQRQGVDVRTTMKQHIERSKTLANDICYHISEIHCVGCEIKDCGPGFVDFPCMYEGRVVHLCWQLGEPKVLAWHEYTSGFENRRPIDRSFMKFVCNS